MDYKSFKEKTRKSNVLLKSDILGSFDFYTYIICLESIEKRNIDLFVDKYCANRDSLIKRMGMPLDFFHANKKLIPLAAHEYTHFIDSTSTLWGVDHLKMMADAYLCNNDLGGTEKDFYLAKKFYDHCRLIKLPDYYTLINKSEISHGKKWHYTHTIGSLFSKNGEITDRPVLFMKFMTQADGRPLTRSPISTVSLLEASAVAQEFIKEIDNILLLKEEEKIIEMNTFSQSMLSRVYDYKLTEYSSCAHLVANKLNAQDMFITFFVMSILTRVCLNFSDAAVSKILNYDIEKIIEYGHDKEHDFCKKTRLGVSQKNLGIIFYVICCALDANKNKDTPESIVSDALNKFGLTIDSINEMAIAEAKIKLDTLKNCKINSIKLLSEVAYKNMEKIKPANPRLNFHEFDLPPVFLGDSNISHIPSFGEPKGSLVRMNLEGLFDELYSGQEWVQRFSEGCA